jgi:hypothetical protein
MCGSILLGQDQPYDGSVNEVQVEAASLEMVSHAPVPEWFVVPRNLEVANREKGSSTRPRHQERGSLNIQQEDVVLQN